MIDRVFLYRVLRIAWQLIFAALVLYSCASPAAPQGGPRDFTPPRIVYELPENYSTNFAYKKITIEFDEYVNLVDQSTNIIISPPITPRPTFSTKGRAVVITIDDRAKLDSATTYAINFGSAIKDNNEGNPFNNYTYAFSTGETIDSLAMTGLAVDILTGDTIIGGLVLLYNAVPDTTWRDYPEKDSTLFLSKLLSVARTDSAGVYIATNLKGIDYKAFLIADENGNNSYEQGDETIGILDSTLNPLRLPPFKVWYNPVSRRLAATPQVEFKLFSEPPHRRQLLTNSVRESARELLLEFASSGAVIDSLLLDSIPSDSLIIMRSINGDSIKYWIDMDHTPDTLKGRIVYQTTDSIGGDTTAVKEINLTYQKGPQKQRKRDEKSPKENPFSVRVNASKEISPESEISFLFAHPLTLLDSARITFTEEIAEKTPERMTRQERERLEAAAKGPKEYRDKEFRFERDSVNILLWYLRSQLEEGLEYNLAIPDSTFVNVQREHNDSLKATFKTFSTENTATMLLNLKGDSSKLYIMEVLNKSNKSIVKRPFVGVGNHVIKYIPAGEYKIRFTEDLNGNGKWDTGSVVYERLPERMTFMSDPVTRATTFTTRDNWEMEIEIDLERLFPLTKAEKDALSVTERADVERLSPESQERTTIDTENEN